MALYVKPKLFLLELEKKLTTIKEAFCKRRVEIREVKLKKPAASSGMLKLFYLLYMLIVMYNFSDPNLSPEPGTSSGSPAVAIQSKLLPSPSLSQRTSPNNASPLTAANQIITNGGKAKNPVSPKSLKRQTTTISSPAPKRKKVGSCSPEALVLENSVSSKPVISPIRVMGASSGDTSSEGTGSSPRENGIPEQYRQDFTKHKGRSKVHRHHHHRSSKPHHERHHHRHHQERGRGRDREEVGQDRRRRDQPSSKRRRTEFERYR